MNREILFRGKRVDNDEWATGYLVRGEHYIYETEITAIYPPDTIFYPNTETTGYDRVFPETIGQYTGLTDKNGKKIFEGDIISATALDTGNEQRAVVCFGNFIDENNGDEYIGFYIEFDGIKTTITQLAMEECKNRIEVIGNIYDFGGRK